MNSSGHHGTPTAQLTSARAVIRSEGSLQLARHMYDAHLLLRPTPKAETREMLLPSLVSTPRAFPMPAPGG